MDTRDGRIYEIPDEATPDFKELKKKLGDNLVEMKVQPTERQLFRQPPRIFGFEPCPCGSKKKFAMCCRQIEED